MKAKLMRLTREQLEQVYFNFFNTCHSCSDFIEFVPRYFLAEKICRQVERSEIKEHLQECGYID